MSVFKKAMILTDSTVQTCFTLTEFNRVGLRSMLNCST